MSTTPLSLLERAKSPDSDRAWQELSRIYQPMLYRWLGRHEVPVSDADDLVQDVLVFVFERLRGFEHNDRPGAFRNWLRQVLVLRLRKYWTSRGQRAVEVGNPRAHLVLDQLEDPRSAMGELWDREHDQHVISQLLTRLREEFTGTTWEAFRLTAIEQEKPSEVARKLAMSPNAVWVAKSRVLRKLRRLARGLVGSK